MLLTPDISRHPSNTSLHENSEEFGENDDDDDDDEDEEVDVCSIVDEPALEAA